jgi:ribosome-binding factor A
MSVDRLVRVNELIRREIGDLLFRVMNEQKFDLSAVTVTHVITNPTLRQARVLVSIRDHVAERPEMLRRLRMHAPEIQAAINRDLKLKYTPRLTFELDTSLERGDHVLSVLSEIEKESASGGDGSEPQ